MGVYATTAQVNAYIDGGSGLDDAELEKIIAKAERDVDRAAGAWGMLTTGRKFNPVVLGTVYKEALANAVSAQVEYRLAKGEFFFIEGDPQGGTEGPDWSTSGPQSRIGPKVREELGPVGLIRNTVRMR